MNGLVKNLMLWVVVAVVLMVVFNSFSPKAPGSQEVVYSQFMSEVRNDRIKAVDISRDERSIQFQRKDGSTGITTAPRRDERMVDDLMNHNVEIKQAPPEPGITLWSLLLHSLPVLLSLRLWFLLT